MAERFTLTLEASNSTVPAIIRLRRLLKLALRTFGFRCVRCEQHETFPVSMLDIREQ